MVKKVFGLLGVLVIMGAGCKSQEVVVPIDSLKEDTQLSTSEIREEKEGAEKGVMESSSISIVAPAAGVDSRTVDEMIVEPVESKEETISEIKTFTITMKQFTFTPSTITVNKGDKVRFNVTATDVKHGISLPQFGVNVTAAPGETNSAEFIADTTGTFSFRCNVFCGSGHSSMKGTLIVQ